MKHKNTKTARRSKYPGEKPGPWFFEGKKTAAVYDEYATPQTLTACDVVYNVVKKESDRRDFFGCRDTVLTLAVKP